MALETPRSAPPRSTKWSAAALPLVAVTVLGASCSDGEEPVRTSIATSFTAPRALLDKAKSVELRVLEGAATCDPATGDIANIAAAREIKKGELGTAGCTAPARFCGDISIPKSDATRIFEAKAKDGANEVIAVGCVAAKADQDNVPLAIKMFRFLKPNECGNSALEPQEQCDPGNTALCDEGCQSKEILLSIGDLQGNKTQTGTAGQKTDPYFLWPAGSGDGARFFAFFTDRVAGGGNNVDVGLRVMAPDLAPLNTPPALAKGSILLTNNTPFPSDPAPKQQSLPQAAFFQGKYYVVFQDDNSPGSNGLDIHLRTLSNLLASDQGVDPIAVNGSGGEANIQTAPAIAAGKDRVFIAWEDQGGGRIVGRTVAAGGTLGNQNDISTGSGNARPWVAATSTGWVVVWKSGTGIKLRTINASGTPEGTEQVVNDSGAGAEGARVASLSDGRFAVVWSAGTDIFFQRYDAKGVKIAGDQASRVNDVIDEGAQSAPAIAASQGAGGSYVIAWHDASTNHVRARYAGGSAGFLFNNVNGQSTEFQASRVDGRTRANPSVACGGSGETFVAIGWEDKTSPQAGIIARRFPLPQE